MMKQGERTTKNEQLSTNSLLWEINKKGIEHPSYLYGTIHIQDQRVFCFDSIVTDKLMNCEAYAMESVIDEIPPSILNKVFFMKKQTLRDVLDRKNYEKLESILKEKFNMDISMFERTKPLFVSSALVQFYEYRDMPEALDMFFLKIARENHKTIIGIEKFREQLATVNKISVQEQCKMLIELIKDPDSIEKKFNDLLEAYLNADFKMIEKLSSDKSIFADFNKAFLTERNKKMAYRIGRYCKMQSTFCAVGAGHLVGKYGLVNLLTDKGFDLTPVKFSFNLKDTGN